MQRYLESTPDDLARLAGETLRDIRRNNTDTYDSLSSSQQRRFGELGEVCLAHVATDPRAKDLLGKLGPNEEAYGMNIVEVDGAILRLHYYTGEGAFAVDPDTLSNGLIDPGTFGDPHNHQGDISAVVPRGSLVHHCLREANGDEYTAGHIVYEVSGDPTRNYKYRRSLFVPERSAGLEPLGSTEFNSDGGYWMNRQAVHVVSWPEPTVTVFMIDLLDRHESTIYKGAGVEDVLERPRTLTDLQKFAVWSALKDMA